MNKKRIDSHLDLHMILERGNYTYSWFKYKFVKIFFYKKLITDFWNWLPLFQLFNWLSAYRHYFPY